MSGVPSMVHRSGDNLVVRSVVSGAALYGTALDITDDCADHPKSKLPDCKVKRNYSCSLCDYFTQNPRHFLYHQRDTHKLKVRIYECPNCLYASKHFQKLLRHSRMVHGGHVDGKPVAAAAPLEESPPAPVETSDTMKPTVLKCSVCAFTTRSPTQLTKHEREDHIKTKFFRCTKCSYVTHMKARFTKHVKYHSMPMIKCDMCDFRTPYKWNLDRHCKNHNGHGAFRCSACNFTADIKQSLTVHEMNHHVPPVGQAAGLGVGRRRNKVGASDSAAAEEAGHSKDYMDVPSSKEQSKKVNNNDTVLASLNTDDITTHNNDCNVYNAKTGSPMENPKPKVKRPVPNLIPILPKSPTKVSDDFLLSDICAKSSTSALKDFAYLIDDKDMKKVPDLIPATIYKTDIMKPKASSGFFNRFIALASENGNLTCSFCGHESKCLTEQIKHKNTCGGNKEPVSKNINIVMPRTNSSRCQYCRQRCKSTTDLNLHLQSCQIAFQRINQMALEEQEERAEDDDKQHPMENKIFVWNNIVVPMDLEVDDSQYEYQDVDKIDDNVSLDLSVRTHSPVESESERSFVQYQTTPTSSAAPSVHASGSSEKIPTHGTDISVAQHKRVFQCPHCSFWASTASRFHVHIVGHLNKKPFECSLCNYRSNWRWDITKHIKLKSVRDPNHSSARVLMTDETGRRNYTKYNKYLTEIHLSADHTAETSGGSGTRHKGHDKVGGGKEKTSGKNVRPLPGLKLPDGRLVGERKKSSSESKRTLYRCKKCDFKHASREVLLSHVKGHYPSGSNVVEGLGNSERNERHCRLKHSGDIRVVSNKNGQEKIEIEEQFDEPDHIDVEQFGTFKCPTCPYSTNNPKEFEDHAEFHTPSDTNNVKCHFCNFFVPNNAYLVSHLLLHGVQNTQEFIVRMYDQQQSDPDKKFRCLDCPYVTNSKSQYTYHRQFHKSKSGSYKCPLCSYNVTKRHLLNQHLKIHGLVPHNEPNEVISLDDDENDFEEMSLNQVQNVQQFPDIPLVWVSKHDKFNKMYKCRFCPHVNLRKVNIQEHEKMHSVRDKTQTPKGTPDVEHRCNECNYVCNNAGVLSSHSKVHLGFYGTIHCLVDPTKSEDEQIHELTQILKQENAPNVTNQEVMEIDDDTPDDLMLYFCNQCPARFLRENEADIHSKFHQMRLSYKCEHCTYNSKEKNHLDNHLNTHGAEYHERTRKLTDMYPTAPTHQQPELIQLVNTKYEPIWRVVVEPPQVFKFKSTNVPLSGTDLFQQKSEAELKHMEVGGGGGNEPLNRKPDPQFGTLMHGSPQFIYPQTMKNGKMKDKRYKCPKCPSAFEKREQYKVHLGLHGSSQKYNCKQCDYSVKYYANFVQHEKKHKMNADAHAARRLSDDVDHEDSDVELKIDETPEVSPPPAAAAVAVEEKKPFNCVYCPYTNYRKDAVDNHQKRHISISGVENSHTCTYCDYTVPQAHFLRDHVKLHFTPSKALTIEGFMCPEDLTIERKVDAEPKTIFKEVTPNNYEPKLEASIEEKFNNNEGEDKVFVDLNKGEASGTK